MASIVKDEEWKWPSARTIQLIKLQQSTPADFHPSHDEDTVIWSLSRDGMFSIKSVWNEWRVKKPKVFWAQLIWFPAHIPRVSMIVWVAIWNRLNTREKLMKIGVGSDSKCGLCQSETESHDHLFFNCPYSSRVWRVLKNKCNVSWGDRPWNEWVMFQRA